MERMIIKDGAHNQEAAKQKAIDWLISVGGGAIVMDLKDNFFSSLNVHTEPEFNKKESQLLRSGIKLAWRRGKDTHVLPYSGNVVALFPTKWLIDEMDSRNIDALLVVGWAQSDFFEWINIHNPTELSFD